MSLFFISKNPEKYGFNVVDESSFKWVIKEIKKSVKVDDIAKCSGINKKTLLQYNPEILREYVFLWDFLVCTKESKPGEPNLCKYSEKMFVCSITLYLRWNPIQVSQT